MDIEWHVCPGDTSVQKLQEPKGLMSETGHKPQNLLDRIIFATVQDKCKLQAKEVATYAERFRPVYWCFCDPRKENTWKYIVNIDHLTNL